MIFKRRKPELTVPEWKPLSQRTGEEKLGVSIGSAIFQGKRSSQQDSIRVSEVNGDKPIIALLSDGMGGMADGSRASTTCTQGILQDFNNSLEIDSYPRFLKNEIIKYDGIISDFCDENGKPIHSGATLIACIVDKDNLFWATVGDSHLYIIRNNKIIQVNNDHNFMIDLNKKVKQGLITKQQALDDPHKDSLISFLGMDGVRIMDINEEPFKLQRDDIVIMCSDGLYRTLNDEVIREITRFYKGNIQNVCEKLITAVIDRDNPSQDNTSVVIIKY